MENFAGKTHWFLMSQHLFGAWRGEKKTGGGKDDTGIRQIVFMR